MVCEYCPWVVAGYTTRKKCMYPSNCHAESEIGNPPRLNFLTKEERIEAQITNAETPPATRFSTKSRLVTPSVLSAGLSNLDAPRTTQRRKGRTRAT